jgi:hypothetical protein
MYIREELAIKFAKSFYKTFAEVDHDTGPSMSWKETRGFYFGRCYSVNLLKPVDQDYTEFTLKRSWDVKLFVHWPSEDYWIAVGESPTGRR